MGHAGKGRESNLRSMCDVSFFLIFWEFNNNDHFIRCHVTQEIERDEFSKSIVMRCKSKLCSTTWCRRCNKAVLPGLSKTHVCGAHELDGLISTKGWKRCPVCHGDFHYLAGTNIATQGCDSAIERIEGCYHMIVSQSFSTLSTSS